MFDRGKSQFCRKNCKFFFFFILEFFFFLSLIFLWTIFYLKKFVVAYSISIVSFKFLRPTSQTNNEEISTVTTTSSITKYMAYKSLYLVLLLDRFRVTDIKSPARRPPQVIPSPLCVCIPCPSNFIKRHTLTLRRDRHF